MPFTPKVWEDDPSTDTPLDAAGLIDLEERVTDYADSLGGRLIHADTFYADSTLAYKGAMAAGAVRTIYKNTGLTTPLALSYTPSEDCWAEVALNVALLRVSTGNNGNLMYPIIGVTGTLPMVNGVAQPTQFRGPSLQGQTSPTTAGKAMAALVRLTGGVAYTFTAQAISDLGTWDYFQHPDWLWIALKAWALA